MATNQKISELPSLDLPVDTDSFVVQRGASLNRQFLLGALDSFIAAVKNDESSVTDLTIAIFDGTSGKLLKKTGVTIDASDKLIADILEGTTGLTTPGTLDVGGQSILDAVDVGGELTTNAAAGGIDMTWLRWFAPDTGLYVGTANIPTISTKVWSANRRVDRIAEFPDGGNLRIYGSVPLPPDYQGNAMRVRVHWAPDSTDTGDVLWNFGLFGVSQGDLLSTASAGGVITALDSANGTIDDFHIVQSAVTTIPHDVAGADITAGGLQLLHFALNRPTSNGLDTFTGVAQLIGLEFEFV